VVACTGSCLEEAGGPHCLYVNPDDAKAMAHAVSQLLVGSPTREKRIANSLAYVERFRGNNVAAQVVDIYRQLL
jgi:glycosyltransferase involved in cell wall biosynthesis